MIPLRRVTLNDRRLRKFLKKRWERNKGSLVSYPTFGSWLSKVVQIRLRTDQEFWELTDQVSADVVRVHYEQLVRVLSNLIEEEDVK